MDGINIWAVTLTAIVSEKRQENFVKIKELTGIFLINYELDQEDKKLKREISLSCYIFSYIFVSLAVFL